jgi:ParB/RepB/Spo0J family partition protein
MNVKEANPSTLEPSQCHVRSTHEEPGDQLVSSVEGVGLINVPIGREEDGEIRLIDGVRRAKAAAEAGADSIPVLVRDLDDAEARAQSITLNSDSGTANNKNTSDGDREKALQRLETVSGATREEIERKVGLLSEADRIERALEPVPGVGRSAAEKLAERWALEDLREGNVLLQSVDGIGEKKANAIHRHLRD